MIDVAMNIATALSMGIMLVIVAAAILVYLRKRSSKDAERSIEEFKPSILVKRRVGIEIGIESRLGDFGLR